MLNRLTRKIKDKRPSVLQHVSHTEKMYCSTKFLRKSFGWAKIHENLQNETQNLNRILSQTTTALKKKQITDLLPAARLNIIIGSTPQPPDFLHKIKSSITTPPPNPTPKKPTQTPENKKPDELPVNFCFQNISPTPTELNGKIFLEQALFFLGRIKCWLRICRLFRNCKNRQILPINYRGFFEVEKLGKSSAIVQFLKIFQSRET